MLAGGGVAPSPRDGCEVGRAVSQRRGNAQTTAKLPRGQNHFLSQINLDTHSGCIIPELAPASVRDAPRVVLASSWTPSSVSSRWSRRLTIDLAMPSRIAAGEIPPASATSTNVRSSSISNLRSRFATQHVASRCYLIAHGNTNIIDSARRRRPRGGHSDKTKAKDIHENP